MTRYCFIDGCRKPATLILHTHPDDTLLCDDHRSIHVRDDGPLDAEIACGLPGDCWCEP